VSPGCALFSAACRLPPAGTVMVAPAMFGQAGKGLRRVGIAQLQQENPIDLTLVRPHEAIERLRRDPMGALRGRNSLADRGQGCLQNSLSRTHYSD